MNVTWTGTANTGNTTVTWSFSFPPDDPPDIAVPARPYPAPPTLPPLEVAACPDSVTTPAAC